MELIKSYNSLVFYVRKLIDTKDDSEVPLDYALEGVIYGGLKGKGVQLNLNRKYHLFASIILISLGEEGVNKNEVKRKVKDLVSLFNQNKSEDNLSDIIDLLTYSKGLSLLGYHQGMSFLEGVLSSRFIDEILSLDIRDNNAYQLVKEMFGKESELVDLQDKALVNIAQYASLACLKYVNSGGTAQHYLKPFHKTIHELEELILSTNPSYSELLYCTLLVKICFGEGLYIPEYSKDEYLSTKRSLIFEEKYKNLLKSIWYFEFFNFKVSVLIFPVLLLILEYLLLETDTFIEFGIFNLAIDPSGLKKFDSIIIYLINPLLLFLYLIYLKRKWDKKLINA